MQHNPVLDANLACISRYNPKLSEKIIKITELKNEIYFAQTVLNEPNLVYNGFVLHDLNGAENEAVEIFNKTENHPLIPLVEELLHKLSDSCLPLHPEPAPYDCLQLHRDCPLMILTSLHTGF